MAGLLAVLVVVEQVLASVTQDWSAWMISNNLFLVLRPASRSVIPGRTPEEALGLLAAYVGGLLLISGFLFWRRDVAGSG